MEGAWGIASQAIQQGINMKIALFSLIFISICSVGLFQNGCATQRTEYHYRSQSEADSMGRPVDETFVKADGTKVVYSSKRPQKVKDTNASDGATSALLDPEQPAIDLREKKASGDIVLRAIFPEQVVDHVTECVRNEEYDLIWNQLLSAGAKNDLDGRGGLKYFTTFFTTNRKEVMATLNCMKINFKNGHVIIRKSDDTHLMAQLDSSLRKNYKFTTMEFESTPTGMKLVSIR